MDVNTIPKVAAKQAVSPRIKHWGDAQVNALSEKKVEAPGTSRQKNSRAFKVIATIAIIFQSGLLFLALFGPTLPYAVSHSPDLDITSPQFVGTVAALTRADLNRDSKIELLTNGAAYYKAELAAIRSARTSINLEAYIFEPGRLTEEFLNALTEKARAGVKVNLLMDAIGSKAMSNARIRQLTDAGGRYAWYHPLRWYNFPRINNRTHRELLVVDGRVGFIGGSGFADHWLYKVNGDAPWRDTMVRVEGRAVAGLQSTFAENWLEGTGDVLTGPEYFRFDAGPGATVTLIVASTPTVGRSTEARVLFQTLLASASREVLITTPYFLPDNSLRDEMIRAIKERGVKMHIVVPGAQTDHQTTRRSSRRLFGDLLEAGAKIYEYQPAMIHAKTMVIDGTWSIVGSTNLDPRSFGLNDEVNMAVLDRDFAGKLARDFWMDRSQAREITLEQWKSRPVYERFHEWFGALIERQQ